MWTGSKNWSQTHEQNDAENLKEKANIWRRLRPKAAVRRRGGRVIFLKNHHNDLRHYAKYGAEQRWMVWPHKLNMRPQIATGRTCSQRWNVYTLHSTASQPPNHQCMANTNMWTIQLPPTNTMYTMQPFDSSQVQIFPGGCNAITGINEWNCWLTLFNTQAAG